MTVSLLSLPSFNKRSSLRDVEVEEEVEAFSLMSEEALEPPEYGVDGVEGLEDVGRVVEDFVWQLISDLHSQ